MSRIPTLMKLLAEGRQERRQPRDRGDSKGLWDGMWELRRCPARAINGLPAAADGEPRSRRERVFSWARILASMGCGGQRTWLKWARPDRLESSGGGCRMDWDRRKAGVQGGSEVREPGRPAGLGRGRKLAGEGCKRERCRRPQSWPGEWRKEAQSQKALPAFQPG